MNSKIFNFVLENGKFNFEIECILVKCLFCSLRFLSKNYGKSLGSMAGLASHKTASGLALCSQCLISCILTANPGDAADNHLFLH